MNQYSRLESSMDDNHRYDYSYNNGIPSSCSSTEYMSMMGDDQSVEMEMYGDHTLQQSEPTWELFDHNFIQHHHHHQHEHIYMQSQEPFTWIRSPCVNPSLDELSSFPAYHPIDLGTSSTRDPPSAAASSLAQFVSPRAPNYSYITTPPTSAVAPAEQTLKPSANASASSVKAPPSPAEERKCRGTLQPGGDAEVHELANSQTQPTTFRRPHDANKHNMSEKRRRDRMNSAMNDLFSLVPNCQGNKCSRLNDAIHYFKSLQQQVKEQSVIEKRNQKLEACVESLQQQLQEYSAMVAQSFLLQQRNQRLEIQVGSLQRQLQEYHLMVESQYAVLQQQDQELEARVGSLQQQLQYARTHAS